MSHDRLLYHRAMVCVMAKGCIVARELPFGYFLFLLPNYANL